MGKSTLVALLVVLFLPIRFLVIGMGFFLLVLGHQIRGNGQGEADEHAFGRSKGILSASPLDKQTSRQQLFEMMIQLSGGTHPHGFLQRLTAAWSIPQGPQNDNTVRTG